MYTGVIVHGERSYGFGFTDNCKHGTNVVIQALHDVLFDQLSIYGKLPKNLLLQVYGWFKITITNCGWTIPQSKTRTVIWLVIALFWFNVDCSRQCVFHTYLSVILMKTLTACFPSFIVLWTSQIWIRDLVWRRYLSMVFSDSAKGFYFIYFFLCW